MTITMTNPCPTDHDTADEQARGHQSNDTAPTDRIASVITTPQTSRNPQTRHEKPHQHTHEHERREMQSPVMNTISQLPEPDVDIREAVVRTVGPLCADGNGTLTPLFFSDDLVDIGRAKAICAKCPLRANCLIDALDREEPWGVWGGELLLNGHIVTSKRACGRPPKRPRPVVVIDEMGPVERIA